ncbi:MAG: site-specific integrase [Oscillospiraceae bacterium]|jgi:integrase|nr:site-specific integrase [Oscillospiraceae bacterium]
MARRGENIYKRKDGRWEGRYIRGRKKNGRPAYGYVYGCKYGEVKAKLLPLRQLYAGKQDAEYFRGTFGEFARAWLAEASCSAAKPLKPSTLALYASLLRTRLLPAFGARPLSSLTPEDIRTHIRFLSETELSANSIRNVLGLLSRIMQAAAAGNAIPVNPCAGVAFPRKELVPVAALRLREQEKLERAAAKDKDGLAVQLALYAGLRIGEICALKWEDIDLEAGVIHVRRTLQRIAVEGGARKTALVFGAPKSIYSRRDVPMAEPLRRALASQDRTRGTGEHVIACKDGFAEPRTVRCRFAKLIKRAGLDPVRFHTLRHTFATRSIEKGTDITALSRLLGHASVKMTLDVYTDATPESMAAAVHRLDSLYGPEAVAGAG